MKSSRYNWTPEEMILLARSGIGRVARQGHRGSLMVTPAETVAMAATLILPGFEPLAKGQSSTSPLKIHHPIDGDDTL